MPKATGYRATEPFIETVTDALKHFNDPLRLGQYSPLATPYFLGFHLQKAMSPESALGRGKTLQTVIYQAVTSLWPGELPQSRQSLLKLVEQERTEIAGGPRFLFLLLDLRYFRRYFLPNTAPNTVGAMYDLLNVSETRFFAHLQTARRLLADALLRVTRPSLRLEQPLAPLLVGRDQLLEQCNDELRAGRSVTLSGVAGVGKTSVGAHLAQHWPADAVFWHTFRPGLNDDLASLAFGVAHFMHRHDCSSLWLQLAAGEGLLGNIERLAGFLREDLERARRLPALLCFDEVDLLHTSTAQPRHGAHKQVLELLESLRTLAPLLLIGQRGLINTDTHHEILPLTLDDTEEFLLRAGLHLRRGPEPAYRLTEGNPRLLEIYVALQKGATTGEELELRRAPSVRPLFNRLWKRLDADEKHVLMGLSVFRSFAPLDAWQGQAAVDRLQQRKLLKPDARGGIALLPLFRELVYDELSPTLRRQYHEEGALIRARRGQYTEAAYHLWQAERFDAAIDLWFDNQGVEIEQGKAGAAYALFGGAKPPRLSPSAAKRLKVIRDRLSLLHGSIDGVLEDIDSYSWHLDEKITADALDQWGQARLIRGDIDGALADFNSAITVLREMSTQVVQLHRKRGQMYIEQAALDLAERESRLAQFEVEQLRALVEMAQGNHLAALEYLRVARRIAETVSDTERVAKTDELVAMAAGNYGDYILARQHAQAAMAYFERTGNRLRLENLRAELAGFYLNERKFTDAIEPLESALRFFENIKHDLRVGYISSNLAEAYFESGQMELAERYSLNALHTENPRVQPYACYTLGQVRHRQKRMAESEIVFQTGIQTAELTGDAYIAAYLYRAYGHMLCRETRGEEGIAKLQRALDLFSQFKMQPEVERTNRLIATCTGLQTATQSNE